MKLYKKSKHIYTTKIDNETFIIVIHDNYDMNDIKKYKIDYSFFKDTIIRSIEKDKRYMLVVGNGSITGAKVFITDDFDTYYENCRFKPFLGGVLDNEELEILNKINRR